ncbi:hypothetical protein NC652_005139 [Populus alba x Populus x berolinensis]|nr:hypothetical protein NC652_005139 [Populus alba x Populus x berolinensis]
MEFGGVESIVAVALTQWFAERPGRVIALRNPRRNALTEVVSKPLLCCHFPLLSLASVRNKRSFIRDVRREIPAHSREIHRRREWWEKGDWTGYKELGVEKSGRNAEGDTWWETWQEMLHQDEWSNLARIERSAQKQAKLGTENAGWYEKWWEKYDAKGWTEKGANKYGRLNEQSWWEKWGEHYDGRGSVTKWTDKWAETELGTKWGDKWEEKFFAGIGSRHGETWHGSPSGGGWSRTWGEEHLGNGKVHKYGKGTTGESWDIVVDEETYYEAEPHYGWADVVGESSQLLSIEPQERPPGVYPYLDFGSSPPPSADDSLDLPPPPLQ